MSKSKTISKKPYISIIIPLYNEESRLSNLYKVYDYFEKKNLKYEVILINDGSTDKSLQRINTFSKKNKLTCISYKQNMGKGYAIKCGMLKASGDFFLFSDIDLSTPIQEFNKFLPLLGTHDILIGSRKTGGSIIRKHQPFLREYLGKGFTLLSQIILHTYVSDFTCGFKCFSRKAARDIFSKQTIQDWGFDSEVLFLARKLKYKIKEIPVEWSNDPNSKVSFPKDIINALLDLYRIRLNVINKTY